jgi:diguanylate cyclase (GGDEF)-like protein
MFMDLDGFKTINDSLGHCAGDELLRSFAKELQKLVRRGDTIGRLGGEEFAVLFDELNSEEVAAPIVVAILEHIQKDFSVSGVPLRVTASVGIASYPKDGNSVSVLLKNADIAMYEAKQHGRNTNHFLIRR